MIVPGDSKRPPHCTTPPKKKKAAETFRRSDVSVLPPLQSLRDFLHEKCRIRMFSRGLFAVHQFAVHEKLEHTPPRGNQLQRSDVVLEPRKQCLGNAERFRQVPSTGTIFHSYAHHASSSHRSSGASCVELPHFQ